MTLRISFGITAGMASQRGLVVKVRRISRVAFLVETHQHHPCPADVADFVADDFVAGIRALQPHAVAAEHHEPSSVQCGSHRNARA